MIALEVTEDELVSRLLKRGETSGRSDDTDEEIIRKRFAVYKQDTSQVAEHYKEQDKFEIVKGEGTVDDIFENLQQSIEEILLAGKIMTNEKADFLREGFLTI